MMTIALPLVAPGVGAAAIFNLAAYWSEFCLALALLESQERFTMPLGLFSFQSAYETDWQLLAAASFIALVPVISAFVLLQRFFVAGLTAGAVQGELGSLAFVLGRWSVRGPWSRRRARGGRRTNDGTKDK